MAPRNRRLLRIGFGLLAGAGLISLGLGLAVPATTKDPTPIPIALSTAVPLPAAPHFGGRLVVYGHPTTTGRIDCTVRSETTDRSALLSASAAEGEDRLVVDGVAVRPLLLVTDPPSPSNILCTGGFAATSLPLYLIATNGHRDELPMAAFSFATLALVLGLAGAISLRPPD